MKLTKKEKKVTTQKEIAEAVKNANIEPIEIKEPDVEIKYQSRTTKLPKAIRVTQNVEQTKTYKPVEEDIDYTDYAEKYNNLLNLLLIGCIIILFIIIVVSFYLGLQLLGVI